MIFSGYFPFSEQACVLYVGSDILLCTASIWHMCTLSVDRFVTLRYPMKYGRNKTRQMVLLKIAFVWLISACITSPVVIMGFLDHRSVFDHDNKVCAPQNMVFVGVGSVVAFYVPLVVMVVTFVATTRILHRNRKYMRQIMAQQKQKQNGASASVADLFDPKSSEALKNIPFLRLQLAPYNTYNDYFGKFCFAMSEQPTSCDVSDNIDNMTYDGLSDELHNRDNTSRTNSPTNHSSVTPGPRVRINTVTESHTSSDRTSVRMSQPSNAVYKGHKTPKLELDLTQPKTFITSSPLRESHITCCNSVDSNKPTSSTHLHIDGDERKHLLQVGEIRDNVSRRNSVISSLSVSQPNLLIVWAPSDDDDDVTSAKESGIDVIHASKRFCKSNHRAALSSHTLEHYNTVQDDSENHKCENDVRASTLKGEKQRGEEGVGWGKERGRLALGRLGSSWEATSDVTKHSQQIERKDGCELRADAEAMRKLCKTQLLLPSATTHLLADQPPPTRSRSRRRTSRVEMEHVSSPRVTSHWPQLRVVRSVFDLESVKNFDSLSGASSVVSFVSPTPSQCPSPGAISTKSCFGAFTEEGGRGVWEDFESDRMLEKLSVIEAEMDWCLHVNARRKRSSNIGRRRHQCAKRRSCSKHDTSVMRHEEEAVRQQDASEVPEIDQENLEFRNETDAIEKLASGISRQADSEREVEIAESCHQKTSAMTHSTNNDASNAAQPVSQSEARNDTQDARPIASSATSKQDSTCADCMRLQAVSLNYKSFMEARYKTLRRGFTAMGGEGAKTSLEEREEDTTTAVQLPTEIEPAAAACTSERCVTSAEGSCRDKMRGGGAKKLTANKSLTSVVVTGTTCDKSRRSRTSKTTTSRTRATRQTIFSRERKACLSNHGSNSQDDDVSIDDVITAADSKSPPTPTQESIGKCERARASTGLHGAKHDRPSNSKNTKRCLNTDAVTSRTAANDGLTLSKTSVRGTNQSARKCLVRMFRRKQSSSVANSRQSGAHSQLAQLLAGGTPVDVKREQRKRRRRKTKSRRKGNEQKASKVLGIIFAVFVILWTPLFVLNILSSVCASCARTTPTYIFPVFTWLGYLSSLMNPIIYTMFNTSFRRAFKRILCCEGKQTPPQLQHTQRLRNSQPHASGRKSHIPIRS